MADDLELAGGEVRGGDAGAVPTGGLQRAVSSAITEVARMANTTSATMTSTRLNPASSGPPGREHGARRTLVLPLGDLAGHRPIGRKAPRA